MQRDLADQHIKIYEEIKNGFDELITLKNKHFFVIAKF